MSSDEANPRSVRSAELRAKATQLIFQKLLDKTYADAPDTSKMSTDITRQFFSVGASSMRGWRRAQEDTYDVACLSEDEVFAGVFDGHGGADVASFCADHLRPAVVAHEAYAAGKLGDALTAAFLCMDEALAEGASKRKKPADPAEENLKVDDVEQAGQSIIHSAFFSVAFLACSLGVARARSKVIAPAVAIGSVATALVLFKRWAPEILKSLQWGVGLTTNSRELANKGNSSRMLDAATKVDAETCGATSLCAMVQHKKDSSGVDRLLVTIANAGDCRCIISEKQGEALMAVALTQDHKPTLKTEKRRILLADSPLGRVDRDGRVNGDLDFSRSLGDLKYKGQRELPPAEQVITAVPEVQEAELQPGGVLLLASDGVWDSMSSQAALDFAREERARVGPHVPSSLICEALLTSCVEASERGKRGSDNMTCILVESRHV